MPTRFVVTGFSHFCGVASNPTEVLVNWLEKQQVQPLRTAPAHGSNVLVNPPAYTIQSCRVLEVSAAAVDAFLEQQRELLLQAAGDTFGQPVVLLHLGVDTQRPGLNLESQAFNNATFRCPDQQGWQPTSLLIEQGPGLEVTSVRTTSLPLQHLAEQLQQAGFDRVQVSTDAGRFVCNYTYHKSLQLTGKLQLQQHQQVQFLTGVADESSGASSNSSLTAAVADGGNGSTASGEAAASSNGSSSSSGSLDVQGKRLYYSLFVHVPPFECVSEEEQKQFILELLKCISACVAVDTA